MKICSYSKWQMLAMPCSQNRDLKCNRICKLPVSSSCLGTFYDPYPSFLNYQFLHYLVLIMNTLCIKNFWTYKIFQISEYKIDEIFLWVTFFVGDKFCGIFSCKFSVYVNDVNLQYDYALDYAVRGFMNTNIFGSGGRRRIQTFMQIWSA